MTAKMLKEGDRFPDFSLRDQNDNTISLSDLLGTPFLVYFYPKDDTPGCTTEAREIRDAFPRFEGVKVFGVSPDSPESHRNFIAKFSLPFTLLADEEHVLAEACGVWVEKADQRMGVQRASFLIDENGIIEKAWPQVKPEGHAEEVLAEVARRTQANRLH